MKIYFTHIKNGKVFQQEHKIEKLHREGNDFIVFLKSFNGMIYPAFWLSDCGKRPECSFLYKFSKRQKKIVQRNW